MTTELVFPPACRVELVTMTNQPLRSLAAVNAIYSGYTNIEEALNSEVAKNTMKELQSAVLQTPLEMVHYLWFVHDVSRAFTHQIVRYRVGVSFAQESMRFADASKAKVLAPAPLKDRPEELAIYQKAIDAAMEGYTELTKRGIANQDARGALPTNILTHIYCDFNHKSLMHIYRQRMSGLAQPGEWQYVLAQMKSILEGVCPALAATLLTQEEWEKQEADRKEWRKTMLDILHPEIPEK